MRKTVTGYDVQKMVRHWLNCPVYGYLGSDYGQDLKAILQNPLSGDLHDRFIRKLREEVPPLGSLPPGDVNIYLKEVPGYADRLELIVEVAGQIIAIGN